MTVLEHMLRQASTWTNTKGLSAVQLTKLTKLRSQLKAMGKDLIAFTLPAKLGVLFVEAPSLAARMVWMGQQGEGGTIKDPHLLRRRRSERGTILKHKEDIAADKAHERSLKTMRQRAKAAPLGVYRYPGLPSSGTYKWDGKHWWRWDGTSKWLKHTRKKGHPPNWQLTDDRKSGRLTKKDK